MSKTSMTKGKKALLIIGIILGVIVLLSCIFMTITAIGNKANLNMAKSFEKVNYDNQLTPIQDENGYWTFTTDNDFKVMQLTDVHIGGGFMSLKKDSYALNAIASMVSYEKPDLVIVTGDVAYPVPFQAGTFNNLNSSKIFAALMEQLGVYWTLAYGNHDTEIYSYYSREELTEFYTSDELKYCLFEAGPEDVDGQGNQVINVKNSLGIITQSFFVFDSHSYTNGDYFGIKWEYDKIHDNQIEWYKNTVAKLNEYNAQKLATIDTSLLGGVDYSIVKSLAFFHIPVEEYNIAWHEYVDNEYQDTENVTYISGVAGETGKIVFCAIEENNLFETMLELGSTKGLFVGHDHLNNFSIDYKGIRLTYGMSIDYLAYSGIYKKGAQRGCTIITVKPDSTFDVKAENYYQEKYTSQYEKEKVSMS